MSEGSVSSSHLQWARLRFSIIGSLLAAPPELGDLGDRLDALSKQAWTHPTTGERVMFARSTIERWFYQARGAATDPVLALARKVPSHAGTHPSLSEGVLRAARTLYDEHRSWRYQLLLDNLRVLIEQQPSLGKVPSYTTLRRWMKEQGLVPQRKDAACTSGSRQAREVRSYEATHVHGLWHLDFHEGSRPVLLPSGTWVKPQLIAVLDDRSRLCCHAQWYLSPSSKVLTHALTQAIGKRGLPRALMSDNGGAMLAGETTAGLDRLGIDHALTKPRTPEQNGKQESWWNRIEGRLLPMLEGEAELTLPLLNRATQAWVECEYNCTEHSETKQTPLARFIAGPSVGRESPSIEALRGYFRIEERRRQRKSDGTITVLGRRFEVPSRYRTFSSVSVRFARWDLSTIDLVDPRTGTVLCTILPLDKAKNSDGRRRALGEVAGPQAPITVAKTGVAPLLSKLMADYSATGLPPAYLPLDHDEDIEDAQ